MGYRAIGCIVTLILSLLATPLAAETPPAGTVPHIGWLRQGPLSEPLREAFRQGLRDMGYVEGQNLIIEYRFHEGQAERLRDLAAELVRLRVDALVTNATAATAAARDATQTIPIVFGGVGDPVGSGFVASLSRPGGNITGVSGQVADLMEQSFQLLKEVAPGATRVAGLITVPTLDDPIITPFVQAMQEAARSVGVQLHILHVPDPPNDLERAFATLADQPADALYILTNPQFRAYRSQMVELVAKSRLPAIYATRDYVDAGGLMAYSADVLEQQRRAGNLVGKILHGAKPADLPVEQPTKFKLVLNLKTAKALGITMPPSLLLLADEVIR
jgi:putative tryptophan/tyrosine transport system substrate-binding protein